MYVPVTTYWLLGPSGLGLEFRQLWVCEPCGPCVSWLLLDLKTNKNNHTISYALNSLSECHPGWKVVGIVPQLFLRWNISVFISTQPRSQCQPLSPQHSLSSPSSALLLCSPHCTDRSNGIWDLLNCIGMKGMMIADLINPSKGSGDLTWLRFVPAL